MNRYIECIEKLKSNICKSVTPFQTVNNLKTILLDNDFTELNIAGKFDLEKSGKYFISVFDTSLVAFTIGKDGLIFENTDLNIEPELRIVCSHTDYPCFKIKPKCEIVKDSKEGYVKLNTETYGGPILNTWLDRPLSVAGRVIIEGKNVFCPKNIYVDFKRPIITIPNIAIHQNRDVNKGVELNRQKDMLPVTDCLGNEISCDGFLESLAQLAHVETKNILDYELYVYQCEHGDIIGINNSLFSSPRLDNMTSVYSALEALITAKRDCGINMAVFYDNEEIGSKTKQGAGSTIIDLILEKIYLGFGIKREEMIDQILKGMIVSLDVAHATHPNHPEKADITNRIVLNGGVVIKQAANQTYANDAKGVGILKSLANKNDIDIQVFVNRSDMQGGQTLGSIVSSHLPMRTVDIGVPILAMHSARELMGVKDQKNIEKLLTGFYS